MHSEIIEVILPVFLVVGAGYAATYAGLFQQTYVDGLMKFTQSFAIPCLLFNAMVHLDLSASFSPPLIFSFYSGATVSFLLALFGARFVFGRAWTDSTAIGFCALFSNATLLGLPITERAYGADSLTSNYAIIAFHSPFCYGLGITVMEVLRNRGEGVLRTTVHVLKAMFQNTLILGITLGLAVNLSGITIPTVGQDAIDLITQAALPAALFALGGVLVQYRPQGDMRVILYVCMLSLIVHPAIMFLMGTGFALDQDQLRSGVLTASMATGINGYVFANLYGCAKRVAASSVLLATALSMVTIWGWLTILG